MALLKREVVGGVRGVAGIVRRDMRERLFRAADSRLAKLVGKSILHTLGVFHKARTHA
jgi:hypothetical protein